jgi:sphingosine kinase
MDQPENLPPIVSERVLVNGNITLLTLTSDGRLRWTERGQRSLTVEKDVLGFATEGPKIRIRAVVEGGDRLCFFWSRAAPVRKDFVFQPLSEDSLTLWCQKLREFIDSLGKFSVFYCFSCCAAGLQVVVSCWNFASCFDWSVCFDEFGL